MNIALIDLPDLRPKLFPFALTRPIGTFRVGILTIQEKWQHYLNTSVDVITSDPLINAKYQQYQQYDLVINATILPDQALADSIDELQFGQSLCKEGYFIASRFETSKLPLDTSTTIKNEYLGEISFLDRTWDIFLKNEEEISKDFKCLTQNKKSYSIIDPHTIVYGADNVFLAQGASVRASIINAEKGPVYLDENSEIQEGCVIKGPFYLGKGSKINAGAVIREGCSFGPSCKVGGEVSNAIIFANSNKAHDGFLGNAVIGEFCNLGAATNCSNLKNNYEEVKMYDYVQERFIASGLQFCGLMMGDHSKSAIGTLFNTGTTVGAHCNVFGSGFPKTFIPSFSWGGSGHMVTYTFDRAMQTAEKVMARRDVELTETDRSIFQSIFEASSKLRS